MTSFSTPMQNVMIVALVVLVILILLSLIYAIRSHRFTDKIVAANMIGSLTMNIVVIFAIYLGQSYILDIGIIIALLSFLSVIVLCRVVTDHIFGQLRHMRDHEHGEVSAEHMAKVGTEHHTVRKVSAEVKPGEGEAALGATEATPTDATTKSAKSAQEQGG